MSELRLIDANALKHDFRKTFVDGEMIDVREVIERIELLSPTIDAEPVRHARWNEYQGGNICSKCNKDALCNGIEEEVKSNFCPNCGARMDEVGE